MSGPGPELAAHFVGALADALAQMVAARPLMWSAFAALVVALMLWAGDALERRRRAAAWAAMAACAAVWLYVALAPVRP